MLPDISQRRSCGSARQGQRTRRRHTDLEVILQGIGVGTVFLAGLTTECCVLGTACGSLERGSRSPVVADAVNRDRNAPCSLRRL
ncbi:isochorismatase family protein [Actinomadura madurae]|uniref:isochorismatase family protein n=1 Tax=Actinomadura madurae TaxID=1993 RepID=UPI003999ACB7